MRSLLCTAGNFAWGGLSVDGLGPWLDLRTARPSTGPRMAPNKLHSLNSTSAHVIYSKIWIVGWRIVNSSPLIPDWSGRKNIHRYRLRNYNGEKFRNWWLSTCSAGFDERPTLTLLEGLNHQFWAVAPTSTLQKNVILVKLLCKPEKIRRKFIRLSQGIRNT